MANVCILTDSTAQFVHPGFPGHERVFVVPFDLQKEIKMGEESLTLDVSSQARAAFPLPAQFVQHYQILSNKYDSILVLGLSSHLGKGMENALTASTQFVNNCTIEVFDSQSISIGLGMLIEKAAEAASKGVPLGEITELIRHSMPRIYSLFCLPNLITLARSGYLDRSQAIAGEIVGMLPLFTLEEGSLTPMEKVRTPRHLFEAFQDFLGEFESPAQIVFLHGQNHSPQRVRPLRQYIQEFYPETPFSELPFSPLLTTLLGEQAAGLVISEL